MQDVPRSTSCAQFCTALSNSATFCKKSARFSAIFNEKIDIRERCKGVPCVDLDESFSTSIYYLLAKFGFDTAENFIYLFVPLRCLQFSGIVWFTSQPASQPRTSLVKFARSPHTDPSGSPCLCFGRRRFCLGEKFAQERQGPRVWVFGRADVRFHKARLGEKRTRPNFVRVRRRLFRA